MNKPKFKKGDRVVAIESFGYSTKWIKAGEFAIVDNNSINPLVLLDNRRLGNETYAVPQENLELSLIYNSPLYKALE